METLKQHWENIYDKKPLTDVSWYEPVPETSLSLIDEFHLPKDASIIDIGGGDSFLSEDLLKKGFLNLSVLDISGKSLERAKTRLGKNADKIHWIESNMLDFKPAHQFDIWHDRAVFHFLTDSDDQRKYIDIARRSIKENGYLVLGTFSTEGPDKCSGLHVQQYSEENMISLFQPHFQKIKCFHQNHPTPFNTFQDFLFCSFKRKQFD
ncbi:MAG: class I SAM-dependent methyltransferase [Chitinophagaceae bacterium]|nr:MAG: class I SAM-dependent methyltransferase [Chitinophagaceae bacterium]